MCHCHWAYRPQAFSAAKGSIESLTAYSAGADWWPHNCCGHKRAEEKGGLPAREAEEPQGAKAFSYLLRSCPEISNFLRKKSG